MRASSARRVRIIGIGAGSPDHVTQQAISALNEVDVFLVADKGETTDELVALRRTICERFIDAVHPYDFVTVTDPQRGPDAERATAAYEQGVAEWHAARAEAYAEAGADAVLIHSKDATGDQARAIGRAWSHGVPLVSVPRRSAAR